ncbi:MAG: alpha/beta hydrolase [Arenimonas sp.]|uniref:alpha/beta hydrolase n=1 Tax=Arenimonas sp. TaxID=1872635 RepID=UPI0025C0B356|nr:alpha/beta hydrolase [Arenimonas sp.]MBW8368058.1 alpha/beta hydrolase [Arenimonas sp.]
MRRALSGGVHPGWRILRGLALAWLLLTVGFVLASAFTARGLPDLQPWHRWEFASEPDAARINGMNWRGYERAEQAVFDELQAHLAANATPGRYRYQAGSTLGARGGATDWNRSQVLMPAGAVRGGVLMLHGLSDSPYSLRHLAQRYTAQGFVVVIPRMPGHGTAPSGLRQAQWMDWLAAAELGAREVKARTGAGKPFHLLGYSNGAALALKYAMDRVDINGSEGLPAPDRMVMVSPMIGIGRLAAFARLMPLLGGIPYFEKSRWLDVQPEFNPFKYNSFPVNGVRQSWLLTGVVQAQLLQLRSIGRSERLPPILAFQSVLDGTVSTAAVVRNLFDQLPANGSELVLFDINRQAVLAPMFTQSANALVETLQPGDAHTYRLTVVGNVDADTANIAERRLEPGQRQAVLRPLALSYPADVYSLSHVALPFPMDDPLYGLQPRMDEDYGIRIGTMALHGERGALSVAAEQLMRLSCNPFYDYLAQRVDEAIEADLPPPAQP